MPVLHIISDTDRRGAQVFAYTLLDYFRERGRDHRIVALRRGRSPQSLLVEPLGERFGVRTLLALRRRARSTVVVAHGSRTLPGCAIALAGSDVPFVYRSVGDPSYWSESFSRRLRVRGYLSRAARIVALWEGAAEVLVGGRGVPRARMRVIPNGVDSREWPSVTPAERTAARRRLALPMDRPILAYVGSLTPEKGVETAIFALKYLAGYTLLIAGDGPERSRLESLADQRVTFAGAMEQVRDAYAAADVIVLPSVSEGVPAVLIEAGIAGLPVVASDVGGNPSVVVEGVTGYLIDPRDEQQLARAVTQSYERRALLGRQARQHCLARYDMGIVGPMWDEVLRELSDASSHSSS